MPKGLPSVVVDVPLGGGMSENTDSHLVRPPGSTVVDDMVFSKDGVISRRPGAINTNDFATLTATCRTLFSRHDQLCVRHTEGVSFYSTTAGEFNTQTTATTPLPTAVEKNDIFHGHDVRQADCAYTSGYRCFVWVNDETGAVWITTLDEDGNYRLRPTAVANAADRVTVHALTGRFVVLASDPAAPATVRAGSIAAAGTTIPSMAVVVTDVDTMQNTGGATTLRYQWDSSATTALAYLVYKQTSGDYRAVALDSNAAAAGAFGGPGPGGDMLTCYVDATASTVYLVTAGTAAGPGAGSDLVYLTMMPSSLVGPWGATTLVLTPITDTSGFPNDHRALTAVLGRENTTYLLLAVGLQNRPTTVAWSTCSTEFIRLTDAGVPQASTQGREMGCRPATQVFRDTLLDEGFVGLTYGTTRWETAEEDSAIDRAFLITTPKAFADGWGLVPAARCLVGRVDSFRAESTATDGADWPRASSVFSITREHTAAVLAVSPNANLSPGVSDNANTDYGVVAITMDVAPDEAGVVAVGRVAVLDGGIPTVWDGESARELGGPYIPIIVSIYEDGAAASAWTGDYYLVFYWRDAQGNIHRSAPSIPIGFTSADENIHIEYLLPPSLPEMKENEETSLSVAVYSTARHGFPVLVAQGPVERYVNPVTNDNVTGRISVLSALVPDDGAILYTTGGVFEALPTGAVSALTISNRRIWAIPADAPNTAVCSKQLELNVAPEFNGALSVYSSRSGAEYTAIGELDDKTVLFTRDSIEVVYGDGPNGAGQGAFVGPQDVASDVGCIRHSTVVKTPVGLLFQSRRGLHLLDRGMQVQLISGPVEDTLAQDNLEITAAVANPKAPEVWFFYNVGGVRSVLVFNYEQAKWSRFSDLEVRQVTTWNGQIAWLDDDTILNYEDGSDLDVTVTAPKFSTGWLALNTDQGFKRVREIRVRGRWESGDVTVNVYYDYETNVGDTRAWTHAECAALTTSGRPLRLDIRPSRQKCSAMKIEITESLPEASEDNAGGLTITGISLEVAMKATGYKHYPEGGRK